ncbi:PH domain-containing protein [Nosocomiicoccus massiliensis]|uniref:PH domain-containing protein n=1 Tax=Nosocomiicoccus massiliensis TaxID=1232430 RepID=A0AAF0YGD0_9STAP|nr:PH domain-containing protein [Nosocomiicoccus massiliensis]WOS95383.1 PH domain-containing protein [Nosocomiicoccus massiliensis]
MESVDKNLRPYMQLRAVLDGLVIFLLPTIYIFVSYILDFYFKLSVIIYAVLIVLYIVFRVLLRPILYTRITKIGVYDDYLIVKKGFFFIETVLYPIERVQIVKLEKGFIARRFNLAKIELTNAAYTVRLPEIETVRAEKLKDTIITRLKEVDSDV